MTKNSVINLSLVVHLVLIGSSCGSRPPDPTSEKTEDNRDKVVFRGTVLAVAPNPMAGSGIVAIYQLAKYRVDRVCQGQLSVQTVVVDHLILTGTELESIKPGTNVCVVAKRSGKIPNRWDYPGIREPSEEVKTYYVGENVKVGEDPACECP
jgi:hypothetical protein